MVQERVQNLSVGFSLIPYGFKGVCLLFIPVYLFSISLIISVCFFCSKSSGLGGGLFSFFKGLAGQKTLTLDDINPVLDKMKEHLIGNAFLVLVVMMYSYDSKLYILALTMDSWLFLTCAPSKSLRLCIFSEMSGNDKLSFRW